MRLCPPNRSRSVIGSPMADARSRRSARASVRCRSGHEYAQRCTFCSTCEPTAQVIAGLLFGVGPGGGRRLSQLPGSSLWSVAHARLVRLNRDCGVRAARAWGRAPGRARMADPAGGAGDAPPSAATADKLRGQGERTCPGSAPSRPQQAADADGPRWLRQDEVVHRAGGPRDGRLSRGRALRAARGDQRSVVGAGLDRPGLRAAGLTGRTAAGAPERLPGRSQASAGAGQLRARARRG